MRTRIPVVAAAVLLVLLAGCTRGVDFSPDPGETYAISVTNTRSQSMVVSFEDASGTRLLGTVGPNRTERFVVAGAGSTSVTIVAQDESRTQTVRRPVTLVAGQTVEVRL